MPSTAHMLAFTATALLVVSVPGPSVLFVVTRSLTLGRRAGVATVLGNASGLYVQVLAVAVGLGALVRDSVAAFTTLKLAGAAYLVVLGVRSIRQRGRLAAALDLPADPKALRRILVDGFVVGVANPKTIVFFAAVLPQFADRDAGPIFQQVLVLGAIFTVFALVCDSAWALAAGSARSWLLRSPRRLAAMGGAGGLVLVGVGVGAAVSGRAD